MSARPHEVDRVGINLVDQQEVASDGAITVIDPLPFQAVIQPFRATRRVTYFAISDIIASRRRGARTRVRHPTLTGGSRGNQWMKTQGNADWVYGYDAWQVPPAAN